MNRDIDCSYYSIRSDYPSAASIPQLFQETTQKVLDRIAVTDGQVSLTYQQLSEKSTAIAHALLNRGLQSEEPVALLLPRSADLIVAMLAVLQAGGTYVPVDESCPAQRLRWILEDTGTRLALTSASEFARLAGCPVQALDLLFLAREAHSATPAPAFPTIRSDQRAYIMYTSGSTGTPKGVEVLHRGIVRLVRNTNYVHFDETDVVAQVANPAFDAITFEVWGALLNGARLVILPSSTVLSPGSFSQALATQRVTTMFLTASLFNVMAATVPDAFRSVRTLVVGGDAVPPEAARQVLRVAPPKRLVNGYGPTECTTFSLYHLIKEVPADALSFPSANRSPTPKPISSTKLAPRSRRRTR